MTRIGIEVALGAGLCVAMGTGLLAVALKRLHSLFSGEHTYGTLEPQGALVRAPFSERPALYVRAALRGPAPGTGEVTVLWSRVLHAPSRLRGRERTVPIDPATVHVIAAREYRRGTVRALVTDARVLPRVLARSGYSTAPPADALFELEEEALLPGEPAVVRIAPDGRVVVCSEHGGRRLLRLAWGPLLAALFGLLALGAGGGVLAAWALLRG